MKNTFINIYRKKKATPQTVDLDEASDSADNITLWQSPGDPEDEVLDGAFDEDVKRALDTLPEDYRLAVILVDVQDFTYREVADIFDLPMGTVMSRLYRGRKMLEKALLLYARKRGYLREGPPSRIRNKELLEECA